MKRSPTPAAETVESSLAAFSPKPPDLEFPDWSACDRTPRPASVEQVHRHSEQLLRGSKKPKGLNPTRQPVPVEFHL